MDEDSMENMDAPTVTLTDDAGLTLTCYVEHSLDVEDQEYVLLLPVDSPIEIFAWQENGEEDEAVLVEDQETINLVFPIAKAVLEEQNLALKQTAVVLTVEGDLPDLDDEESWEGVESDGEDDQEELQLLASFWHEEQEYAIYTPLDPYFILARLDDNGNPHLLSQEELKKIEPMLPMIEDQLFDEME
ncbi:MULTISPECIES: DUF3727 domain-containing protein [Leptolyngbya]|jgi:hypothetical protein|uniref:DUF3727 domain-containing protein n=2 Tax=Leptolyngbya boryana TaxID=1184 RepID=A0A1Z4J9I6_LEPBY|nr:MULTISPECIES: DUF3727 domain-containing protein [Leptolyngbya]BAY53373.1 hypothetical protein NIES2135_01770 [Leptolyngbya boryana NIES-2135]MBD1855146.1 DUF3727 domain-containing protein [Leptolyngbya sp. FACHB-1624]MBD2366762.1 DUF3727 domain-containing protein [Leptolyngbya sp. FACHB-161]MBD2373223.1 DUF3727 domain-containing protein [Leptolyngbya sp. FACHB-238]MBD2397624.1 DUF3727 domain-containing protein [Leptolyngbya sp. FACHB-239]